MKWGVAVASVCLLAVPVMVFAQQGGGTPSPFLGTWEGQWSPSFTNFRVEVKSIEGSKVQGVYNSDNTKNESFIGILQGNTVVFLRTNPTGGKVEFTLELQPDGTLKCKSTGGITVTKGRTFRYATATPVKK